jgi:redox-sensitive bicupin YhaK (pirin superfamily)
MKKLVSKQITLQRHWVGDGFPVRTMFTYNDEGKNISPFLLMDYAGPETFAPSEHIRGVGEHPHRGFETVTIVYDGEVEHRDSAGGGGRIGPGDIQWMTAASGLVHEEMHGKEFAKNGGRFEMIQLWVNLPAKDKKSKPKYQTIQDSQVPVHEFPGGKVRVIAGELADAKGPALTFTPINLWDIRMKSGSRNTFTVPEGHTAAVFVLNGTVRLNSGEILNESEVAFFETQGTQFSLEAADESKILFLGGEPINEPVVGYGPFVMNTKEEIQQAFADYQKGLMGKIAP